MFFLSDPLIELAMQHFDQLPPNDAAAEDQFFVTLALATPEIGRTDRSRDSAITRNFSIDWTRRDRKKYAAVHKGTPFYFLMWTAFDLRNYERALYYLDAAISEDVRTDPRHWANRPAALF